MGDHDIAKDARPALTPPDLAVGALRVERSKGMNVTVRQQDTLRRQTDRALTIGDHVSAATLRRRLCAACELPRTACLTSLRRSCSPEAARVA